MFNGKSEAAEQAKSVDKSWPGWARGLVSLAILIHVGAVLAGVLGAEPSSTLEEDAAKFFLTYNQWVNQGVSYRYYSTAFPPTPVVTATLTFADGRAPKVVRLPDRDLWPRLRLQRQLALAHGLMDDVRHVDGDGSKSLWANAFATHLGKINPGCSSVSIDIQEHLIPRIERIQRLLSRSRFEPIDLDSSEFFSDPQHIGDFPCDAS